MRAPSAFLADVRRFEPDRVGNGGELILVVVGAVGRAGERVGLAAWLAQAVERATPAPSVNAVRLFP